jgi:tetratricopeptide (TPR) repeat protein
VNEVLKRLLDKLHGRDFWIGLVAVPLGVIVWLQIGISGEQETLVFHRRIFAAGAIATVAAATIWLNHILLLRTATFGRAITGILVMRISGDNADNSMQLDLVESLNTQLQREPQGAQIEIHAGTKTIDLSRGLPAAHKYARVAGERVSARLVVWGTKVGDSQFFPRVTIVAADSNSSLAGEHTYEMQDIRELRLPTELIKKPLFLAQFAEGYSNYDRGDFKKALPHLNAAIQHQAASARELADLRFFTARCYLNLSFGQKTIAIDLQHSITLFDLAAREYIGSDEQQWIKTQINIAVAYGNLPTIERSESLQRCISILTAALKVCSEEVSSTLWADIQMNLGNAHSELPSGDRNRNLQQAIDAYEAALRVRTESAFPEAWAALQDNLGNVYKQLPIGDSAANLRRAIAYHKAALRVRSERKCPREWALSQNNLGAAYHLSSTRDPSKNIRNAIEAYSAALRVRTETVFPVEWALTQHNLGVAYSDLPTGNRGDNLRKAIDTFEAALRVRTEIDFPIEWGQTQHSLANAYHQLPAGDRTENTQNAITAFTAALRVRTELGFPRDWAMTQYSLAGVYAASPIGDPVSNLNRAIRHYEAAAHVDTKKEFPRNWANIQNGMGFCYWKLGTSDDLRRSFDCYQTALTILTREQFPLEWALASYNLGVLYADKAFDGERIDNLRRARACFESVLPVLQEGSLLAHLHHASRALEWIDRELGQN